MVSVVFPRRLSNLPSAVFQNIHVPISINRCCGLSKTLRRAVGITAEVTAKPKRE
jgi:hypothetical protein